MNLCIEITLNGSGIKNGYVGSFDGRQPPISTLVLAVQLGLADTELSKLALNSLMLSTKLRKTE